MERRLSAILAADVVGYSRMIRADEDGTITALRELRTELIDPQINQHRGRIVKLMGDGLLAEFSSVVDAVAFASYVQRQMSEINAATPEAQQIVFRIGINLGDVVIDGDDIQGDGVNVAARLEGLSEPGGICIADSVYEQVRDRLDLKFQDFGGQDVKNIDRPVRAWKWSASGTESEPMPKNSPPLSELPSIAVLPFDNMSGDPEQEYFADGITEDIITDLSKLSGLLVIARNSTFSYKGRHFDARQISLELRVRYVMEGSVRRAGDRVRINAQLIDGESGTHVWAERYDRVLNDIFAIQDEISESIVQALRVELEIGESDRIGGRTTVNVEAYDYALRGRECMYRMNPESNSEARSLYETSLALDPEFSRAHAELAIVLYTAYTSRWNNSSEETFKLGVLHAKKAVELAPDDAYAHRSMAYGYLWSGDLDHAVIEIDNAVALGPNTADVLSSRGYILSYAGRAGEALESIEKALCLNPEHPAIWLHFLGHAHFVDGNYEEAVIPLEQRIKREPSTDLSRSLLAACYGLLGLPEQAKHQWAELVKIDPNYASKLNGQLAKYKDPEVSARFMQGLQVAGFHG